MALSKDDKRELRQDTARPKNIVQHVEKKSKKWLYIGIFSIFLIVIVAGFSIANAMKPGPLDDFAKCLSNKGVEVYGAMGWCKYTQGQKAMFGKSFKYLNYEEYTEYPEEEYGKISKTPTWIIDGEVHENTQSLEKLASLTGCSLS